MRAKGARPLGAAIVGAGFAAASHLDALRRVEGAKPRGVLASSPERGREAAERLGIGRSYGALDDILADDTVDVVHNCTPNHVHEAITSAALDGGKHVLSEKPLGLDLGEAEDLASLARFSGLVTGVCFNYRHFPLIQHLRETIRAGTGGTVHLIHGAYLQDWLLFEDDWNWRLESAKAGGTRAVGDIGSHWIDLVQHVTADEVVAVCAQLACLHAERSRPGDVRTFERSRSDGATSWTSIDTEDVASILLRFRSGATGACTISQVSAGRKNALMVEFDAARESYAWNQEEPNILTIGRRDAPNEQLVRDPSLLSPQAAGLAHYPGGHQEGWPDALRNLLADFYGSVAAHRDGRKPPSRTVATFDEALGVARVVEAILQSDRDRGWVEVRSEVTA
jgi:predicted dehydrogenase